MNDKTRYGIPLNQLQHDLAILKMQHMKNLPLDDDQALMTLYYNICSDLNESMNEYYRTHER